MPPHSAREAHLVPGFRLDRYELLCPYAQGGMAIVWLARLQGKHGFEKIVAIKTMNRELAGDPTFRTMMLDEARIAAKIRHPNVAEIDDLGEEGSTLYLVMEWIDGDSLARLYQTVTESGQPFPLGLLLRVASDTCAGLYAAHGLRDETGHLLNVVHRDVSPQNVLISTSGVTKVIDFGIAKARDRLGERTKTGMLKGKVEYAAPEQVHSKAVDARADIWAVGVMMYQILSGNLPFQGRNELETLKLIAGGRPPAPLPPTVPAQVADIVMRAMRPKPEERFQTALDMHRAIEAAMTQPFSAGDVAAFMSAYLAPRIEERRQLVLRAKNEANARAGGRQSLPQVPAPNAPPISDWVAQAATNAPAPMPMGAYGAPAPQMLATAPLEDGGGSRLSGGHKMAMAVTTVLAAFVWGLVALVVVVHPAKPASASPQPDAQKTAAPAATTEAPKADPPATAPPTPAAAPSAAPPAKPTVDPPVAAAPPAAAPPAAAAPPPAAAAAKPAVVAAAPPPAAPPPAAAPPAAVAAKPAAKPAGKKPKVDDGF